MRRIASLLVALTVPVASHAQSKVATTLYKEGVVLGNEGKVEEALPKFQGAVGLEPKVFLFQLKLAYAYEMLKRYPEAHAAYERAVALNPRSPEARRGLADVLRRVRFLDAAERQYREALRLRRNYKEALVGLAYLYADRGDLDRSAEVYAQVLRADPKDADAAFRAANVLWRLKRHEDAVGYYRKALQIRPDFHDARFGLGITLRDMGDTDGARRELKAACEAGVKQACKRLFQM